MGFDWFFRQLYPALSFFANKIVNNTAAAEEIASGAFIKIWKRHSQFEDPKSIRAYLYQVVRNDALKWLKKIQKETTANKEIAYLWSTNHEMDPFQHIVMAETYRQLHASIELLPPECGKVFRLLYVEGKSVRETARELDISPSTVKTQKQRGLAVIRKKLITLFCLWNVFLP